MLDTRLNNDFYDWMTYTKRFKWKALISSEVVTKEKFAGTIGQGHKNA